MNCVVIVLGACCCDGRNVGLAIKRSRVRLLVEPRLRNDSGQCVHALVLLSSSSITQHWLGR